MAALVLPTINGELIIGRVTGFGLTETETGSYPIAVVQLPAGSVQVQIPRANYCAVGSRIRLIKRSFSRWYFYGAAFPPCDARNAP